MEEAGEKQINPVPLDEEAEEAVERHHTTAVEVAASGTHYFTVYCDGIDYGASGPATARLFVYDDADDFEATVIDWHMQHNKPPSLSGAVSSRRGRPTA